MKKIFFYPNEITISEKEIFEVLKKLIKFFKKSKVEIIKKPLIDKNSVKSYLQKFVLSKISNLFSEEQPNIVFKQELDFEKKFLLTHIKNTHIYDAFELQQIYKEIIKCKLYECHIVFTHRIIATFDEADKKYHARVVLLGYPNIISIPGLYVALALPKDEYLKKFLNQIPKDNRKINVEKNLDKFLLKYILQCVAYIFYNEIFCNDKECLCYDNHFFDEVFWQVRKIKLNKLYLCERHKMMLDI